MEMTARLTSCECLFWEHWPAYLLQITAHSRFQTFPIAELKTVNGAQLCQDCRDAGHMEAK